MHDYRLYIPPGKIDAATALLDGDEFHYCAHVLRQTTGAITVFDGVSREWNATIMSVKRHHATLRLDQLTREEEPSAVRLAACPAMLKAKSFDDVVESATELGAHAIAPIITAGCDPNALKADVQTRLERWRRITVAAAKQSGRIALPELRGPMPLDELLAHGPNGLRIICTRHSDARPLLDVLEEAAAENTEIALLVGPEADFTPEEIERAIQAGARAAQLGPTTLRSGVAVAAALAVTSAWLATH